MANRKTPFVIGEFYHIYNRGVDKRNIFSDEQDVDRFMQSMDVFNVLEPIGSIYEKTFEDKRFGSKASKSEKLVNFIAYCLNPNHYHFILEPLVDRGIEKFMQRLGTGDTKYFNNKYKRSGALFQGKFKSIHINSNEYLLHLSAYVNLNWRVHQLGRSMSKLVKSRSSWGEYTGDERKGFCEKGIILEQFKNKADYKTFAQDSLESILERKADLKEMGRYLLE
ncbi:MAG: transposase [bacterium]|nr:transposase [bacterium]